MATSQMLFPNSRGKKLSELITPVNLKQNCMNVHMVYDIMMLVVIYSLLKKINWTKCNSTNDGKNAFKCTSKQQPHSMSDSLFRSRRYRFATNHVNVVVIIPIIITSTTIIYRIQKIVWANVRSNVQVKPIDVTAMKVFLQFNSVKPIASDRNE